MDGVVFARFDFEGDVGKVVGVVNEVVDFAVFFVVVVVEVVAVRPQFLGDYGFVDGAEVDAVEVGHDGADVVAEEDARKYAHVVEVEFQQVFAAVLREGIGRLADGFGFEGDACVYRSEEELAEWKAKDPIPRFARQLVEAEVATQAELDAITSEVAEAVAAAVRFAEASPVPSEENLLEDVYA